MWFIVPKALYINKYTSSKFVIINYQFTVYIIFCASVSKKHPLPKKIVSQIKIIQMECPEGVLPPLSDGGELKGYLGVRNSQLALILWICVSWVKKFIVLGFRSVVTMIFSFFSLIQRTPPPWMKCNLAVVLPLWIKCFYDAFLVNGCRTIIMYIDTNWLWDHSKSRFAQNMC